MCVCERERECVCVQIHANPVNLTGNPAAEGTGYVFMKKFSKYSFYFIFTVLVCCVVKENVFKASVTSQSLVLKQFNDLPIVNYSSSGYF